MKLTKSSGKISFIDLRIIFKQSASKYASKFGLHEKLINRDKFPKCSASILLKKLIFKNVDMY